MRAPAPLGSAVASGGRARCLLAVVAGARSVDDVADRAGLVKSTAWSHLRRLERDGLIAWPKGTRGALRATVRPVPFRPPPRP